MTQIMMVGIQLYSSLSLLARQSMLMLTEFPGMVTVSCRVWAIFPPWIQWQLYLQGTAFETLLALNYNSFILTVAIIGVGTHSIEAGGYNVFDSHARDLYHNSHSEGTGVLLEIPSLHKLVQYFRTLHATFEPHLFSSNIEHCSISSFNSYIPMFLETVMPYSSLCNVLLSY